LDNYDLHNHSTCSDGLLSPTALIELAARTGVDAIALTDHDTTDGLEEAARAAKLAGIGFVPGVEISVSWGDTTLHVVGLRIDPMAKSIKDGLEAIRTGRHARAERIGEALQKLGHAGTFEGAYGLAENKSMLGRTHFARHLVNTQVVKDIQHAFDKYLAKGKPAYVSHRWASLEEAIRWIKESGGVAVLAHPGRYKLKPMGRDEVTGSHRPEDYATWQRLALEHGFLASRGADYHGPGESPAEPGTLPRLHASLTPVWSHWAH
jgi:predicted metal-dependent phosphoesterase TrpH